MKLPSRETVDALRFKYPIGCRVVLDSMDDPYTKIPVGSQATCEGVDDAGNIICAWDMGSHLSIAWPVDRCHKASTDAEAEVTLNWYGKHQRSKFSRCPRCGEVMKGLTERYALSRRAGIMICNECGTHEALEDAGLEAKLPLSEWDAIQYTQEGSGRWHW